MSIDQNRPIIIKRKKVAGGGGHHGGAWKVAYADFVTAMMAFFLLMWLLNATTEDQRKGLADYFNPTIPISRVSAGGAGVLEGRSLLEETSTAGSVPKGEPPKRRAQDSGPVLGDAKASPDGTDSDAAETVPDAQAVDPAAAAAAAAERAERERLEAIGREIAERMRAFEDGSLERHFFLRLTPEGLVIEIIDADDQPLFASGSAEPAAILATLTEVLVPALNETTNDIAVVGHTDAISFGGANYSNWELSADRASAARRLLTAGGLPETRIKQVTGKAAVDPLVPDRNAPQNRRIAITPLSDRPRKPRVNARFRYLGRDQPESVRGAA